VTTKSPAKTRLPAAERRELILRAAMNRFGATGYDQTRLEDIAADAGVTKPILYRHFGSKKGLYLAVLARHREDLPTFLADLPTDLPFDELVREILDGWLAYAHENQRRWRMLFRDHGGDEDVQRARSEVHERARQVLAVFLAEHPGFAIPADQLEPTAELLSHGLAATVLWWSDHPQVPRATLVEVATRAITGLAR
jgi:AcrR family transcriptional regulator